MSYTNGPEVQAFEEACKRLNVPTDRINLVKRNLQLKGLLIAATTGLEDMYKVFHNITHGAVPYDDCNSESCKGGRELIARIRKEMA